MKNWDQLRFYCRRAGIRAVFGLAAVQFLHTPGRAFAQEGPQPAASKTPPCVLYVQNLKIENESSWQERGYRLVEKTDLLSLPTREMGRLLDDTHFSLIRRSQKSEFWMSLSRGQVEEQWNPLIMQAPAVGQDVAPGYGCLHLQERLEFFRETRRALINAMKLSVGRPADQLRGEVILDLERSFFVHKGRYEYADTSAKERYRRILNEVRPLSSQADFFQAWFEVRRRVYGPRGDNINYCGGVATMTEAMVKSCTNCVGETYLLMALFQDAGFRPPAGWQLGVQFFNNHLRPVLYHPQNVKTFDLVTGGIGQVQAPVLGPEQIEIQLWLGHSALRPASEVKFMRSQATRYLNRPANCHLKSERREYQAADWTQIENCGTYPGSVPDFASNASKVESVSREEESPEKLSLPGSLVASEQETQRLFEALERLMPTLNAAESKLVQDILDGKQSPQAFLSQFSVRKLTSALGYSYLLQDPRASLDPIWQSTFLPRPIREATAQEAMANLVSNSVSLKDQNAGMDYYNIRRTNFEGDVLGVTSEAVIIFDSKLWGQIKDLGLLDRHRIVYRWVVETQQRIREQLEKNLLSSLDTAPLLTELAREDLARSIVVYAHNQTMTKAWRDFFAFGDLETDLRMTPLARTFESDLGVPSSAPFVRKLKQHLRTLSTHPVEVLRWVDSQEASAKSSLQRSLQGMGELMVQISGTDAEPPWVLRPNEDILYRVLTHPQYFFTVLDAKLQKVELRGVPVADARLQDVRVEDPPSAADQIQLPKWEGPSPCSPGGASSVPESSGYGIFVQCRPKEQSREVSPVNKTSEGKAELSETGDQDPRLEVHLKPSTWQWLLEGVRRPDTILMDSGVRILLHHVYRPALKEVFRRHRYARDWMSFDPSDLESTPVLYDSDRRDQDPQGTSVLSLQRTSSETLYGSLAKASFFRVALKSLEHLKPGYVRFVPAVVQPRERDLEARLLGFLQLKDSAQIPSALVIPMFVQDPSSHQVVFTSLSKRHSSYSIFKNSERLGLRQLSQQWLRDQSSLRGGGMGLNEVIGRRGASNSSPIGITLRRFIYERQKIRWSIVGISADEPLSFNQLQSLEDF